MNKRFFLLFLIVGIFLGLAACSGAAEPEEVAVPSEESADVLDVAFVLPGLISDGSFNAQAYKSILETEKALGMEYTYVEGLGAPSDAEKAIRDYAAEGWSVVWAHGGQYPNAVLAVAPDFPDTTFVTLAGPGLELPDNVWISGNDEEDGFFMAGVLAGLKTESNTIGYVGGMEIPIYAATAMAYEAGAKYVNPDVEVLIVFTGDFNDPTAAKEAAVAQIESGADVIAHSMNLGAFGLFEAAEEAEGVWVIGKDNDQSTMAPGIVLTSVIFDYETQMQRILERIAAGEKSGYLPHSLREGTVYLAPFYGQVSDEIIVQLNEIEEKLRAGEVDFPTQLDL